jgi:hypothetical protein
MTKAQIDALAALTDNYFRIENALIALEAGDTAWATETLIGTASDQWRTISDMRKALLDS